MSDVNNNGELALLGGVPVRGPEKKWPKWPVFDGGERDALLSVLDSGIWFYGERVARFEREFAEFQGAGHCVTVNSGTAALEVVLQALGIGPGDEVLVPPYTFVATASAVARVGAVPVFVDVDHTWCMDPDLAAAAITPKTKAIMPVHFGGRICDMDRFNDLSADAGIPIIEDACHSWGGHWVGRGTGTLGLCGVFSFQLSKNITAGEGGAIVTDDAAFAEKCRSITNCGRVSGMPWYHHENVGTNARLTEFQAALLSCQLTRLGEQTLLRERNAQLLNNELGKIEGLTPQPKSNRITRRAYHLYCLRIDPEHFGCSREQFTAAAQAEGWPVSAGYPLPLHEQPVFQNRPDGFYKDCRCPVAEDLCRCSGMWTTHEKLLGTEGDMLDIVAIARKIKDNVARLGEWKP